MTLAFSLAALLCGIIHIVADHRRAWITTWWSKPATMLAIIGVACAGPGPLDGYGWLIVFGLACSLVGDVFLMLRPARFVAGLVAFFFAHVIYIAAFTGRSGPGDYGLAVLLAGMGIAIYAYLRPGLGSLRLPVLAYVAAIVTMVWTAVTASTTHGGAGAAAAAAGALFFLASDTSLGIARFRHRYPGAQAVTLGTYYLGQWLIALSAGPLAAVR